MKSEIHPKWNKQAQVTCSCGNTFTTGSTKEILHVAICAACHPVFTGQEKLIDTEGLVQKFQKRERVSKEMQKVRVEKSVSKDVKQKETSARPKTLKDMLAFAKKQQELQ
jgi:large subunit ribosomal protein L31